MNSIYSTPPSSSLTLATVVCILAGYLLLCGSAQAQHLSSAAGTHLDLNGAVHLVVPGNVDLGGTSSFSSTSRLVLSPVGNYKLEGVSNLPYVHLNGNDITLTEPLEITGGVHIASGRLILGDNDLTLGSGATITGSFSATSMIVTDDDGRLCRIWDATGSYTYPTGDMTGTAEYSPATIQFTSGSFSNAALGVRLTDTKHPQNGSTTDYLTRYWTLEASGVSGFSANTSFAYVDADITGSEANMVGGRWSGSAWSSLGAVTAASNLVSGAVSGFGDFTAGESGAVPVELVAFSAVLKGSTVHLLWETATEVNNFGFRVERRTESEWQEIGFIPGAGNSAAPQHYAFQDVLSASLFRMSKLQYRLRQIDRDGSATFSPIVHVLLGNGPQSFALHAPYPNPTTAQTQLSFTLAEDGSVRLTLHDAIGRELAVVEDNTLDAGYHVRSLQTGDLPRGMYLLRLMTAQGTKVRRLIVSK